MIPINFKESNKTLKAPVEWDEEANGPCGDLYTYNDDTQTISLWKLSWKEIWQIVRYRKIWVGVMGGGTQPPIWLDTDKTVFHITSSFLNKK